MLHHLPFLPEKGPIFPLRQHPFPLVQPHIAQFLFEQLAPSWHPLVLRYRGGELPKASLVFQCSV